MKKKLTSALSLVVAFSLMLTMLTACGGTKSEDAKTIHTVNYNEPGSLDPALAQGTHESWMLNHLYTGLLSYDKDGKVVEGMAKMPKVSEDGLTYTFTIKDGMEWSNGDPVTAEDFAFEWMRVLDPNTASEYAYQLYYIKGAEAYNAVEKPGTYYKKDDEGNDTDEVDHVVKYTAADTEGLDIKGKSKEEISNLVYDKWLAEKKKEVAIKAKDDKTLVVKLENPTPYFPELTAFYTYYPVNSKIVKKNKDWAKSANEDYTSNGPFKLKVWEHDKEVELVKNDKWYKADDVKIDGINFDILEDHNTAWQNYDSGKYQILYSPPQEVVAEKLKSDDKELKIGKELGTYYYTMNMVQTKSGKPLFKNKKVRKAFSMAMDRKTLVEKVAKGGQYPATGLVPNGIKDDKGKDFRADSKKLLEYNPKKAKKLLKEGMKEEGLTKADMNEIVLLYNTDENHKKLAQALQQMWKKDLGVKIGLENCDFNVKLEREHSHDFDISRAGWIGDYDDPMTFMDLCVTGGPMNFGGYSNPEYDALINKAKSTNDQKVRMDSMKKAEEIIMDDMPVIPLYFYTQPYFVKPNVKGIYKPLIALPIMTYAEIS